MRKITILLGLLVASALPAGANDQRFGGDLGPAVAHANRPEAAAPTGTVTVSIDGGDEVVWPFTASDFGQIIEDPINLVFVGDVDPRNVRAVLMSLDGNRTAFGFPDAFPFNCTWTDAAGYNQTSYAAGAWAGSSIQLQCGEYTVLRTHLRLFRYGRFTLGGAHFELMVPGTADHRVLSWELPESMVAADLVRSGLLAGAPTALPLGPAGSYRTIDHRIFNSLPPELRHAIGLPLPDQTAPVPLPTDGRATVLKVSGTRPITASDRQAQYHRDYNIVDAKPFCNRPLDYILIQGPIDITHHVTVTEEGDYHAEGDATGVLTITPFDPVAMVPVGAPVEARIRERQLATISDGTAWAENVIRRVLLSDPEQALFEKLRVGTQDRFELDIDCGN